MNRWIPISPSMNARFETRSIWSTKQLKVSQLRLTFFLLLRSGSAASQLPCLIRGSAPNVPRGSQP